MGFDGRYGGERSRDDEEIESLAAFHGIDVEVATDVLAQARQDSALDDYRRPPREWFRMVVERRRIRRSGFPESPEGLLDGDPLAEFNKRIYRITLIGGGIGRKKVPL